MWNKSQYLSDYNDMEPVGMVVDNSNNLQIQPQTVGNKGFTDCELSKWLEEKYAKGIMVGYVFAKHYFKVCEIGTDTDELFLADPGDLSSKILKETAKKKNLKRLELSTEEIESTYKVDKHWKFLKSNVGDLNTCLKKRNSLYKQGRGKAISPNTAAMVWHDAGGRCMYEGCAKDLGFTTLTTKNARIAYLAHIVASDPDGPRGSAYSHELSDSSENIMLMCDAHHRLIDRVDIVGHSTLRLQNMRADHVSRVNYLLKGLSYPKAQIITLLADIAQVATDISQVELMDSLLSRKLAPANTTKHHIRRTQKDKRDIYGFWSNFLNEHESEIRDYIHSVSNKPNQLTNESIDAISIFPLHLVPVLIMCGRILGEARRIEVFQYNRVKQTWKWDVDSPDDKNEFRIHYDLNNGSKVDETIISIELTADIDQSAIPTKLKVLIDAGKVNWIRIRSRNPHFNSISNAKDFENFTSLARKAILHIQDVWHSKTVHLFGLSPACTLFRFGQLLQAGHHPLYKIYDRPDGGNKFISAIEISGNTISSSADENHQIHKIQLK